jgi:hypothetical protein
MYSSIIIFAGLKHVRALESMTFESGSRLERIEQSAFSGSRLKSIGIPFSLVVLGKDTFYGRESLASVTFGSGSRLEWINQSVVHAARVSSSLIASSRSMLKETS